LSVDKQRIGFITVQSNKSRFKTSKINHSRYGKRFSVLIFLQILICLFFEFICHFFKILKSYYLSTRGRYSFVGDLNECSPHARFLGKIQPERSEAWRFFPKPEGLDLAGGKEHSLPLPTNE
jgi:hypothetical protein